MTKRLAAAVAASAAIGGAAFVGTQIDGPSVPGAPGLTLQRPVLMSWTKVPDATGYRIWLDGRPVKSVAASLSSLRKQRASVKVECPGRHRLNVQARNAVGLSSMNVPRWVTC